MIFAPLKWFYRCIESVSSELLVLSKLICLNFNFFSPLLLVRDQVRDVQLISSLPSLILIFFITFNFYYFLAICTLIIYMGISETNTRCFDNSVSIFISNGSFLFYFIK